ncbi:hypothetical protein WJX73_008929 [Symbiochloris irregularis]|uniref:Uncharacterized protein n=1 Tax=Symbiochloris irregularis TaxID=706552 RepID=A0AAW1PDN0_9CHLO
MTAYLSGIAKPWWQRRPALIATCAHRCSASRNPAFGSFSSRSILPGQLITQRRNAWCSKARVAHISVSCSAAEVAVQNPFPEGGQLSKVQDSLANIPRNAQYALAVAVTALAAAVGFVLGSRSPAAPQIARLAGAAAAAFAAFLGIKAVWAQRIEGAGIAFKNMLAARSDPSTFSKADLDSIGTQWGLDPSKALVDDLKQAYDSYIEWVMPKPDGELNGTEADRIRAFKDALQLSDEDAAPVHLDVGRRILRLRYEAGGGKSDIQQRKALQKLIYVSSLVFGERKAAFLLPWKRACDLAEATVAKAISDNASALLRQELSKRGEVLQADESLLDSVKAMQTKLRASDEAATSALNEHARGNVETALTRAIQVMQIRGQRRDVSPAITEISQVINYTRDLEQLASTTKAPTGIVKVTIFGGPLETKRRELADLFRMYVEEAIKDDNEVTDELEDDIADLQVILGLGTKEAGDIVNAVTINAYRELLREAVQSGELDKATSKAQVLERLCDQMQLDGEAAAALHKQMYRAKLDSLIEPKLVSKTAQLKPGEGLTDDEEAELQRMKTLLCVPVADTQQAGRDVLGRIYAKAVEDALGAGVDRFGTADRDRVRSTQEALRLDEALAKETLERVARRAFLGFLSRARNKTGGQGQGQHAGAKELESLVYFSNICVAPLLEDLKSGAKEKAQKSIADLMLKAKEAGRSGGKDAASQTAQAAPAAASASATDDTEALVSSAEKEVAELMQEAQSMTAAEEAAEAAPSPPGTPKSITKGKAAAAAEAASGMKSQKEITVASDLGLEDRLGVYRTFFIYCMTGHVTVLPMGATITAERDPSAFARLSQLGDLLGLGPMDITKVHSEFAERAFQEQVKAATSGGRLTDGNKAKLEEVREQLGLPKATSDRIINEISNQRVTSSLQQLQRMGQLNLPSLLAIKESGQSVEGVPSDTRLNLFAEEVKKLVTNGEGEFDEEEVLQTWPKALGLQDKAVTRTITELTGKRKSDMLVQAVANLRTRNFQDCVRALNNVIACSKALPSDKALDWRDKAETT